MSKQSMGTHFTFSVILITLAELKKDEGLFIFLECLFKILKV